MVIDLIFAVVFLFSLVFRLISVDHFNFAFTIDQARDMLEIRKLAVGHQLVFIGPVTSLNGVYLGPFWYYFNLPAFLISRGDPTFLVLWEILFFYLIVLIFYLVFRKKNPLFAFATSIFLIISPRLFSVTSYSFNANATPAFVILFVLLLFQTIKVKKNIFTFFLGLLAGLTLQIEAAFGILLLPITIFWLYRSKVSMKRIMLLGFGLTLLPQVLFEIKHRFLMSKVFLAEFLGKGDILGDKLGLGDKIINRYNNYLGELRSSLPLGQLTLFTFLLVVLIAVYIILKNRKQKNETLQLFKINLSLLLTSVVFYFIYPNNLKDWWTINFVVIYLMIFALSLSVLWQTGKRQFQILTLVIFFMIVLGGLGFYRAKLDERLNSRSADPALLANQIDAIDWVYKKAEGASFKVYDYTPAIYDYGYQYLFWWYGLQRYGYQPSSITYSDNVPEYIENNSRYWKNQKPVDKSFLTFLIIERDDNRPDARSAWVDHFKSLCLISEQKFSSGTQVQVRSTCDILKK